MKWTTYPRFAFFVFLFFSLALNLPAATVTWTGGTGDWDVPGNWDCNCVPGTGDEVRIIDGIVTIPSGFSAMANSVLVGNNGSISNPTLNIASGATLTIDGSSNDGLYIGISSTVVNDGDLNIYNSVEWGLECYRGTIINNGNMAINNSTVGGILISRHSIGDAGTFTNNGIINLSENQVAIKLSGCDNNTSCTVYFYNSGNGQINISSTHSNSWGIIIYDGEMYNEGDISINLNNSTNNAITASSLLPIYLKNYGTITITYPMPCSCGILLNGISLDNDGTMIITKGQIQSYGYASIWNQTNGVITVNEAGTDGIIFYGTLNSTNDGTININTTGGFGMKNNYSLTNNGSITIDATTYAGIISTNGYLLNNQTGQINLTNLGTFGIRQDANLGQNYGSISIDGSAGYSIFSSGGTFKNHGTLDVNNGNNSGLAASASFINTDGAILKGNDGFIGANAFYNSNTTGQMGANVFPGNPIGKLFFSGNFNNNVGLIEVDILNNSGPGSGHDQLIIASGHTFNGGGGTLNVQQIGAAPAGDYTIVQCEGGTNCIGSPFSTTNLPPCYTITYTSSEIYVTKSSPVDADNDGYSLCDGDCDDNNSAVHPNATEICDGIDNNCDGNIDEGVTNTYYQDSDGDGYGNPNVAVQACSAPSGYVSDNTDCDDNNSAAHPNATEICDGIDNNCDGNTDEGVTNTYYQDSDADGYGNPSVAVQACSAPSGYVSNDADCNDGNSAIHPNATEICDGIDNNCDGNTDEGLINTYYQDSDEDGYGNPNVTVQGCSPPSGYVSNNTDCDDGNSAVHPNATEICDGIDNNCDGNTDEGLINTYYQDSDADGYGNPDVAVQACSAPSGYVSNNTDCDDTMFTVNPGINEDSSNGIDDNCNGIIDEFVNPCLTTQTQVNDFGNLYSGWWYDPTGTLKIQDDNDGVDNIVDLTPLAGITRITANLLIEDNQSLTSLNGLHNITEAGGGNGEGVTIRNNPLLTDLTGLNMLQDAGHFLRIEGNANLQDLTGLENLQTVFADIFIINNPSLTSLNGMSGLVPTLDTPNNPEPKTFWIQFNNNLENLNALSYIHNFYGQMYITDNDRLTELGLTGLQYIFELNIRNNKNLLDLGGLSSLSSADILSVHNNERLCDCCSVYSFLASGGATQSTYFANNSTFCSSVSNILNECPLDPQQQAQCPDPCSEPAFGLSTQGDCANNQFYVNVNVTDIGFASGVDIYNDTDQTGYETNVGVGQYTVGPFISGQSVTIGVSSTNDANCFATNTINGIPCNDECSGATQMSVNFDNSCTLTAMAYNTAATYSGIPDNCPSTHGTPRDIWFVATVPAGGELSFHFIQVPNQTYVEAYIGNDCNTLSSVGCGSTITNGSTFTGTPFEPMYFRVWDWNDDHSGLYEVCVKGDNCAPPEYTQSITFNCANTEYTIDFNFTSLGECASASCTSLTILNDYGLPSTTVYSTGLYHIGPFPANGTSINLTLDHQDNNQCDESFGYAEFCPPSNDDLCNAQALTLGTGCSGNAFWNVQATTQPNEPNGSCTNGDGIQRSVWFSFQAPASGNATLTYDLDQSVCCNQLWIPEISVYPEGAGFNCGDLSTLGAPLGCIDGGASQPPLQLGLSGLVSGATYYIQLDDRSGTNGYFCIEVEETCVPAEFSVAYIPDCNSNNYDLIVDISYMGTASLLEILLDGNVVGTANSTGQFTISGNSFGSLHTLEVRDANNTTCSSSVSDVGLYLCNDLCDYPRQLAVEATTPCIAPISGTTQNALTTAGTSCASQGDDADVWYSFTATSTIHVLKFSNTQDQSGVLFKSPDFEVWGSPCLSGSAIYCDLTNFISLHTLSGLSIGATYYIKIFKEGVSAINSGSDYFTFDLCIGTQQVPVNDDCSNAIALPINSDGICTSTVTVSNSGATASGLPHPGCQYDGQSPLDIWFSAVVSLSGWVEIDFLQVPNSNFPSHVIEAFSNVCGNLYSMGCTSEMIGNRFYGNVGETLYFRVWDVGNDDFGDFELCAKSPNCRAPQGYAVGYQGDCNTSQFFADFMIIDLGEGPSGGYTSVDIEVRDGNDNVVQTLSGLSLGTYHLGPFLTDDDYTVTMQPTGEPATCAGMDYIDFYCPCGNVVPETAVEQGEGMLAADSECTDTDGWTYYYSYDYGYILLAIKKDATMQLNPTDVVLVANSSAVNVPMTGSNYVTNPNGWYVMNRWFEVTPDVQPATGVPIRFYYTNDDFNDVMNATPTTVTDHTDLVFYKLETGLNPDPTGNEHINATPSQISLFTNPATWSYISYYNDNAAEFMVSSFSGGGGGAGDACTGCGPSMSPLPIELVDFTAMEKNGAVILTWRTLSENNNHGFEIQKSKDGRAWKNIAFIEGHGTSSEPHNYSFLDKTPFGGINYYRLRQMDTDGRAAFSPVRSVYFGKEDSGLNTWPNPFHDQLFVEIQKGKVVESVRVYNLLDQLVFSAKDPLQSVLNLGRLPAGSYLLEVRAGGQPYYQKILKQD